MVSLEDHKTWKKKKMKKEAWKKHSVGCRFPYPQWKNDIFRVKKIFPVKKWCFLRRQIWGIMVSGKIFGILTVSAVFVFIRSTRQPLTYFEHCLPRVYRPYTKCTQLLPNIPAKSVIIIDNAPYHSMVINRAPTLANKKADLQKWLTEHNISLRWLKGLRWLKSNFMNLSSWISKDFHCTLLMNSQLNTATWL